jgi:hypothetical protein
MPIASLIRLRRLITSARSGPRPRRAALPLRLEALEERAVPATVTWVNPSGGDWDTAANWSDGTVSRLPGPNDDAVIPTPGITVTHANGFTFDSVRSLTSAATLALSGGTLEISAASEVSGLTQTGGALTGTGDLTVDNSLRWTGGAMSGPGHTALDGTAEIGTGSGPSLNGRTLNNFGTAVVDDGASLNITGSAVFNNQPGGTLALLGGGSLSGDFNPTGRFNNAGLLVKTGLDNATSTVGVPFDNSGTVDVQTGTLAASQGLTNEGTFGVETNALATVTGGGSSGDLSLAAASRLGIGGTFTFQAGATAEVAAGSQLEIDGAFTQQAGSAVTLAAGAVLNVGPNFSGESYTLAGGAAVSGPGVVRLAGFSSQMTVTGAASIDNLTLSSGGITIPAAGSLTVTNLTQSGGGVTGAGALTVNGALLWTNGTMSGPGHTALHGTAEIGGSAFSGPSLVGRVLDNFGAAVVDDGAVLGLGGGAVVNNQAGAALTLQGSASLAAGFGQTGQLSNAGLLVKAGLDNATATVGAPFDNTGRVVVQTGTLNVSQGLTNEGTFRVRANALATVTGGSSSGAIRLARGSRLTLGGPFTLLSGGKVHLAAGSLLALTGNVTQQAGASVRLAAGSILDVGPGFSSTNYTLAGGAAVTGPGLVRLNGFSTQMTVSGAAAVDNLTLGNGTITVAGSGDLTVQDLTQTAGTVTGSGDLTVPTSLLWTGGTMSGPGHTVLNGTAEISGGNFGGPLLNGRVLDNFGTATIDDGSTLGLGGGALFNNQAGGELDLPGTGSMAVGFGQAGQLHNAGLIVKTGAGTQSNLNLLVSNSGTVEVVLGTLTVNGAYTQTGSGALTVHLAGTTAGTQYGRLQVNGAATLDGALNVVLDGGFTPVAGNSFRVLTFNSRSGDFATRNFPDLGEGLSFNPAFDSTGLNLAVQSS